VISLLLLPHTPHRNKLRLSLCSRQPFSPLLSMEVGIQQIFEQLAVLCVEVEERRLKEES
jgi:hypothetical protein